MAKRSLLIVDDDQNIVRSLIRTLRKTDLEVLTASNGPQALDLLREKEVGVILSDQRMPLMTGVEFLKKARQMCPDTVRMVLSGYTELKSVTDAINQGEIFRFLTKPWEDELLLRHIDEAFDIYEMRSANHKLTEEIKAANDELKIKNAELERLADKSQRDVIVSSTILQVSQEIIDKLPIGIFNIDSLGMIVFVNAKAYELMGLPAGALDGMQTESLPGELRRLYLELKNGIRPVDYFVFDTGERVRLRVIGLGASTMPTGYVMSMEKMDANDGTEVGCNLQSRTN